MIPTKVRDLISPLARDIGIPEEDLTNMVSFYYKENKRILSNLEHQHVILRGLGTLSMQGWLLDKKVKDKQLKIDRSANPDTIQTLEESLALLKRALEMWNKEELARKEFKQRKKQYYINKAISDEAQGHNTDSLEE